MNDILKYKTAGLVNKKQAKIVAPVRQSVVTGRPLYNHPEKDGFANEVFLNADSGTDSPALAAAKDTLNKMIAKYNTDKNAADAEAADLAKGTYDSSTDRYSDPIHGKTTVAQWHALNNANGAQYTALSQLQKDIDKQKDLVNSLLPVADRVALQTATSNAAAQQTEATSKASTMKIVAIGGGIALVLAAIGFFIYLKHKKA